MSKTLIKHHTKAIHIDSIINDKFIEVEGCNIEMQFKDEGFKSENLFIWNQVRQIWKLSKFQYKAIGRYVWFTEEDHAHCCNSRVVMPTNSFSFYAEDINAARWSSVRKAMIWKNGSRAKTVIKLLEEAAVAVGDNPDLWWVSKKGVSLDHWQSDKDAWVDPAWIAAANDDELPRAA